MTKSLFFILLSIVLPFHDFHVSHTTLHYNTEQESIEITVRVAIEDLEKALEIKSPFELGSSGESKASNTLIYNYFKNHLKISMNEKTSDYKWVGKEIAKDLHDIYLFFEISDVQYAEAKSISVENTIFLDSVYKQTNIVLIEFGNLNYNLTFTKDDTKKIMALNR